MYYNNNDIKNLDKVTRLKLINSVTGIKPANLIGSISNAGVTNLAVFSSIVHLGSNPSLLGFIVRPNVKVPRHTYQNILDNGYYTINHINKSFTEQAHYTSANFNPEVSEFNACNLTEEYNNNFLAPYVKESNFKMGMSFKEAIDIKLNGTILVIGKIEHLYISDSAFSDEEIDLEKTNSVGISGLNSYYELKKIVTYPYARVEELPSFNKTK
jgi:flavin reductase (DIM6/NTAB) family NADH-FMN oxidoreductase RutF